MSQFEPYRRTLKHLGPIIFRHVFLLVNGIIFSVVALLFVFKSVQAAIIIGAVFVFNIMLGIIQDTRAQIALEKLQMLTALHITRLNTDGSESVIFAEEIKKDDHIRVGLGDQIPCDGVLLSVEGLEVSEALITGESDSFIRRAKDTVNAGDIVTAGSGIVLVQKLFKESRISQMTEAAKQYTASPSPIQIAISTIIKYSGYVLLLAIAFVVVRGSIVGQSNLDMVLNVGALASSIVPQGLVVITTLLFALGAASYSNKHVLFQEINATEKLGRIKNLCMDKTGTLTGNDISVESMHTPDGLSAEAITSLVATYVHGANESSQTIVALRNYISENTPRKEIVETLPFSSWRRYGAMKIKGDRGEENIFVGAAEVFSPYLKYEEEKQWLEDIVSQYAQQGKRILCITTSFSMDLSKEFSSENLSIIAVFVFKSNFREGILHAVQFFQDRGVAIRILSGDSPHTVSAVADSVGVHNTDAVITGPEMKEWTDVDFSEQVHQYTIFARIFPEQKVKIIEAFKKDGFTAMVGDGANDALAIKKADLGIAMFDGAPATRQLAAVVLMNNSFADLPGGVMLADNFIRNIKIFAGIFINQSFVGLFLFILVSILGYPYPLTPLNITLINYFTIGIPSMLLSYWAISPKGEVFPATTESFLHQLLPFVVWSSIIEAIFTTLVFIFSPEYLRFSLSNTLVIFAIIISGFVFFLLAPKVYRGVLVRAERIHLIFLTVFEILLLLVIFKIPFLIYFFNITTPFPALSAMAVALAILGVCAVAQYLITLYFFKWKIREA